MVPFKKLGQSAHDFKHIVWPRIKQWFGEGELIPIEGTTTKELADLLDQNSGIDAWYIENNKGVRGIASRIQWKTTASRPDLFPYNTFTVRYEKYNGIRTEFEKLCNAIEKDWIYPYWFIQAYLTEHKGQLLSVATCKTNHLINIIQKHPKKYQKIPNGKDAYFKAVPWDDLKQKNIPIQILEEKPITIRHEFTTLADILRDPEVNIHE